MTEDNIDKFAAATIINDYGGYRMAEIPGKEALSVSDRIRVVNRALELKAARPNPELLERLRCLTPPVDEEELLLEAIDLERKARTQLESDGCPPCYPPDLELPLEHVPQEYQAIIAYFKSWPGITYQVLTAQLRDWQSFREFQQRSRRLYGKDNFSEYMTKVRQRTQWEREQGYPMLEYDASKQNQAQDWLEFFNCHLHIHERLERDHQTAEKRLQELDKPYDKNRLARTNRCKYTKRLIEEHNSMLDWIKRMQVVIDGSLKPHQKEAREETSQLHKPLIKSQTEQRATSDQSRTLQPETRDLNTQRTPPTRGRKRQKEAQRFGTGQSDAVAGLLKTRSGRISKPPKRWVPS